MYGEERKEGKIIIKHQENGNGLKIYIVTPRVLVDGGRGQGLFRGPPKNAGGGEIGYVWDR